MQEPIGVVSSPSYDFAPYFNGVIKYVTENFPSVVVFIENTIGILIAISIPVCVLLFIMIIYTVEKLKAIRNRESETYDVKVDMGYSENVVDRTSGNPEVARKWNKILEHVESVNPNDWRQAVIEADTLLAELLTNLGYGGAGVGEQLKRATKGDFKTLDDAWGAHKIRNELAHAGSDFEFSQYDARATIKQYRKVFGEFFFV